MEMCPGVEVVSGIGYIEVRLAGINKGTAVSKILSKISKLRGDPDFLLCLGDDRSDEDMFQVLQDLIAAREENEAKPEGDEGCGDGESSSVQNQLTGGGMGGQHRSLLSKSGLFRSGAPG